MDRTWVIIPVYNEAKVIGSVIADLLPVFPHIVCVDDGSNDGSQAVVLGSGAVLVQHPFNLGQGAALQTGIEYALQDPDLACLVTFDADGQHRVVDAQAMAQLVLNGETDVVLGSRFLDNRTTMSPLRKLILRMATIQLRFTSGLNLTDAHNGLRAISADTARNIHLTQNRMAHASELINQLGELKPRYVEHPIEILYTDYSRSKGQPLLNLVNILADLLFK